MHQPRPYGLFGAEGLSTEDEAAVNVLMRNLTNTRAAYGIDSLKMTRTLPGGGVAVAVDMGGVFKVFVNTPKQVQEPDDGADGLAKSFVPMLFCGVVKRSRLAPGERTALHITQTTQRRLTGYKGRAADSLELQRFVIEYRPNANEFMPEHPGVYTHTQYEKLHPTWFSGAMAEVVQIAAGYGRQDFNKLPKDPVERAQLQLPEKLRVKVESELGNTALPGYNGLPPVSGQIQFDYKFNVCHGVSFGADGKPWLLRVNQSGVYAMPLPLIPATATKAFKAWAEENSDDELLLAIERFGGLPSGESFPLGARFEAWRRAGAIIKVCDVADFYSHSAYSSACGWSFNARGTQAYNTCISFDDPKMPYGMTYAMRLSMGAMSFDGKPLPDRKGLSAQDAQRLARYTGAVMAQAHATERAALRYKLRRVPAEELLRRSLDSPEAEYAYWANRQMQPIANHNGNVARTERGPLLWSGVKFPEPMLPDDALVSVPDFPGGSFDGTEPKRDTIVFAYHVGDDLKVVRNFADPREFKRTTEGNFEDEMIVGSWAQTEYIGDAKLIGSIYTTDIDEREAVAPEEVTTTLVGKDKGYGTPHFTFHHHFLMDGTISRWRYYTHDRKAVRVLGRTKRTTAAVPFLCRDAVIYARDESSKRKITDESLVMYSMIDPHTYRMWTYDEGRHWIWDWVTPHIGSPYPVNGNHAWVVGHMINPEFVGKFSDSGSWMKVISDATWLVNPTGRGAEFSGGGDPPPFQGHASSTIEPASGKARLDLCIFEQPSRVADKVSESYFMRSPNTEGVTFYVDAVRNVAGRARYANLSETGEGGRRKHFGYARLADHSRAHYFIGVVNE